ncbi:MAG TPA: hypothetical protein VJH92_06465 [Candidatus Nanoarchaeia archaeon]|nr:hypothetical protein [Candidatus Nanoarchaeia archaeon]
MLKRGKGGEMRFDPPHLLMYFAFLVVILALVYFLFSNINIGDNGKVSEIDSFKMQLSGDLNPSMISGNVVKEISLPQGYDEFCVVDIDNADFGDAIDEADIRNSLARDSKRNVFLFGEGKKASFFVNDLGVDSFPYYSCAKASGGKIEMELNSDGSSTSVKLPVNEVYCKNAQDKTTNDGKNLCGYLDSVYYEGYKGECCSTYGYCC